MSDFDGEAGQVMNEKNQHYAAQSKSWQAENNRSMNEGMKYNDMADLANVPHPPVKMEGAKRNDQKGPESADNNYNYNANRS